MISLLCRWTILLQYWTVLERNIKIFQLALSQGKIIEGDYVNFPKKSGSFIMCYVGIDVSKKDLSVFDGKDLKFFKNT